MSLILFFIVGSLWLPVLLLQKRLLGMAADAVQCGARLDADYRAVYRQWFWMGVCGFLGMFVIVLMMVTKMTPGQWLQLM